MSNSTVSDFRLDLAQKTLGFNVAVIDGQAGFCRVTIPNIVVQDLWQGNYTVLLNGEPWPFRNWTDTANTYIYIYYSLSEHEISIIPEFPSVLVLPLFITFSTIIIVSQRKSTENRGQNSQNLHFPIFLCKSKMHRQDRFQTCLCYLTNASTF